MIQANAVVEDLYAFRQQLQAQGAPHRALLQLSAWRPLCDIAVDWAIIALAVFAVCHFGWWLAPLGLLVVGNRQRALGNIVHDAAHLNLHRSRVINDSIASVFVAPLVFVDLASYRSTHLRHHLLLGDARLDPDFLPTAPQGQATWLTSYAKHALCGRTWWGSIFGSLVSGDATGMSRLYIVSWWVAGLSILLAFTGPRVAGTFLLIWFASRATVFHAITVFREMCDHFGMRPGGVMSFTRDIVHQSPWRKLIHPRNNGYHLTHHLLPAVPYYRLPDAQRLFAGVSMYRESGQVFSSYCLGTHAVVSAWRTKA